jgi:hypothetical protein
MPSALSKICFIALAHSSAVFLSRILDELAYGAIELPIERGCAERDTRKSRAADDHAIQREVNALLAERADEVIFEFVERDRFSAYGERPKVEQSEFR